MNKYILITLIALIAVASALGAFLAIFQPLGSNEAESGVDLAHNTLLGMELVGALGSTPERHRYRHYFPRRRCR